jgi:hypothetical protein
VVETLVVEKINEKSKPKGWVFSIK